MVEHISHRVAVMYLGKIVELAEKDALFRHLDPYTEAMLARAAPQIQVRGASASFAGEVPSPINLPSGYRFHTRCPYAVERCRVEEPAMREEHRDITRRAICDDGAQRTDDRRRIR